MQDHYHILLQTIIIAVCVGMFLNLVADKLKIPSIGLFLIGGILLGPNLLGVIVPAAMGDGLRVLVALGVSIILFEGALSLDFHTFKHSPHAIRGLLSIGVLITWGGASLIIYLVSGVPGEIAALAGSLVIVTGPTVIGPLLRRVKVVQKLHHVLHWEGVMIDPIGVFIALICFEWIAQSGTVWDHLGSLISRILIGGLIGIIGGFALEKAVLNKLIKKEIQNIFFLSSSILIFGIADLIVSESGLLSVVAAGAWLSFRLGNKIRPILHYYEEVVQLVCGILFLLLSANLNLLEFSQLGLNEFLCIVLLLLVVRPANIFISTLTSSFSLQEKLFLSWLNPRGIIAASMASLFALTLKKQNLEYGWFLESFTFSVIIITVIIHGFFTAPIAKLLKVEALPRTDWLVVGSDTLAYGIARFLQFTGFKASMIDRDLNYALYRESDEFDLIAADALNANPLLEPQYDKIGYVIGATTNKDFNNLVCQKWAGEVVGSENVMFLTTEMVSDVGNPLILNGDSLASINNELAEGNLSLLTQQSSEHSLKETSKMEGELLLTKVNGKIMAPDSKKLDLVNEWLFLAKHRIPLSHYLHMDLTFVQVGATEIISFLLDAVERSKGHHQEIDIDTLGNALLKTEPLLSSYLGDGIAVPRVFLPDVQEATCTVVQTSDNLAYIPSTDKKVSLLFLIIGPESSVKIMDDIIHDIKKIRHNKALLEKLLVAKTSEELFLLLHQ